MKDVFTVREKSQLLSLRVIFQADGARRILPAQDTILERVLIFNLLESLNDVPRRTRGLRRVSPSSELLHRELLHSLFSELSHVSPVKESLDNGEDETE